MPTILKKFLKMIILAIGTLVVLFFIDKLLELTYKPQPELSNIFYLPPNTKVLYKTSELQALVETNSLGFRGRDYHVEKPPNTIRIMAIGDSFVYGWGVSLSDTWIDILEKELNKKYKTKKFEVINFGKSGLDPEGYLEIVQKYVPIYKPDFVMVGILEGDDFGQLIDWPKPVKTVNSDTEIKRKQIMDQLEKTNVISQESIFSQTYKFLSSIYPNFSRLMLRFKVIDVRPFLRDQMKVYINNLSEEEIKRYETEMGQEIKEKFMTGSLNPVLFTYALSIPSHFVQVLDDKNSLFNPAYTRFSISLQNIKNTVKENNGETIIVDVPLGIFVSKNYMDVHKAMGFIYVEGSWLSNTPMEVAKKASLEAGTYFFPNIEVFRKNCSDECFYRYDSHLTPKGNKILALSTLQYFSQLLSDKKLVSD